MKNLIGIVILIVISIATYIFVFNGDEEIGLNTNKEDFKDFAIEDTASVTKIFMSHANGNQLLLTKQTDDTWMVNNEFEARIDAVQLILKTLKDIKVRGVVSKGSMKNTIKRLATTSTKVEFYTGGDRPEKTWYIGGPTASKLGTYTLLEKDGVKSSKPYITHMIMERGSLGSRFFADPTLWRERVVMKCNPKEIKSIEVKHSYDTAVSFIMEQYTFGKFKVTNLTNGETSELFNGIAIPYFNQFEEVFYEYIDTRTSQNKIDSIYARLPRHSIKVTMNDGEIFTLKTYNMPVREGALLGGKEIDYHPERMYLKCNKMNQKESPIVQNYTFDNLTPSLDILKSSTTVEK